jgi:hypothetical protein
LSGFQAASLIVQMFGLFLPLAGSVAHLALGLIDFLALAAQLGVQMLHGIAAPANPGQLFDQVFVGFRFVQLPLQRFDGIAAAVQLGTILFLPGAQCRK